MSKLINDLVGKQCIIRSEFIFSFAGKTELSCKIIDADDEWIKICYTEKKDKQVVKLMRIENIESIEEQSVLFQKFRGVKSMDYNLQKNQNAEQTYHSIRNSIVSAQHRLSTAVNSAMVTTYWEIGEQIFKACGENDRAEYGKKLLEYLSEQLTAEFGKGFDKSNLRKMRQFYCTFPIRDTLCPELSWSHYRVLMRINDEQARRF